MYVNKSKYIFNYILIRRRNILTNITNDYIANCVNDPDTNPYCPIFRIGDILEKAEPDKNERDQMMLKVINTFVFRLNFDWNGLWNCDSLSKKGGVIQIEIQWNCDLDRRIDRCKPVYDFERFDLRFSVSSAASGFNFRFADKFEEDGKIRRILIKAYGIRFSLFYI